MKARRLARLALGAAVAGLALPVCGPLSLWLLIAETRQGRIAGGIGASCLAAGLCVVVLLWRNPANPRPWWIAALVSTSIAVGLGFALVRFAPPADPERSSGLLSRFVGDGRVPHLSPFRLVPEIDQVNLVVTPATHALFWSSRARTIREVTLGLYREIEGQESARGLGPVTHFAALELLGADFRSGHYFAYVPEPRTGERLGAIIFLHGNGGNFQLMPWAWRAFAEEHRLAILCPTYGFGFWGEGRVKAVDGVDREAGSEAVDRVWDDARGRWPIDPARVYLSGLSDGGVGVTRSARAHPERYQGLIYVSPTMKLDELADPKFVEGWKGRPVLVFQGDQDVNVPKNTVDPAIDLLRREGVNVNYRVFPGEDHFLFFSRSTELFGATGEWMVKESANQPPGLR